MLVQVRIAFEIQKAPRLSQFSSFFITSIKWGLWRFYVSLLFPPHTQSNVPRVSSLRLSMQLRAAVIQWDMHIPSPSPRCHQVPPTWWMQSLILGGSVWHRYKPPIPFPPLGPAHIRPHQVPAHLSLWVTPPPVSLLLQNLYPYSLQRLLQPPSFPPLPPLIRPSICSLLGSSSSKWLPSIHNSRPSKLWRRWPHWRW